ncbi:hypothetical protein BD413DRAFT_490424 [Trametes elegans]|nr:hypothetical protein BD413DRAFT_490424 [Trametes elegans]
MFKFNFDVDDADSGGAGADAVHNSAPSSANSDSQAGSREDVSEEVPLQALAVGHHLTSSTRIASQISALPHTFSYSPLAVPLTSKRTVVLARRDLFDARFQLIAADEDVSREGGRSELDFLDAPSDLVPGVYEGGLKTWECSLDLVDCLDMIYETETASNLKGKRVIELGCGTSIPSLYLLQAIFAAPPSPENNVHIHLQDYNELVLRLITLPNVILAWYMSPASLPFRSSNPTAPKEKTDSPDADVDVESEPLPPADATEPGEMPITPALTAAFLESLHAYGVHLNFFSGAWSSFDVARAGGPYHLVLTSETIYRPDSLPSLVSLLRRASAVPVPEAESALAEETARLSLAADAVGVRRLRHAPYLCLVAAKLVYFGVGGGVSEFVQAVERPAGGERARGEVRTVWERIHGVKRSVLQVVWDAAA